MKIYTLLFSVTIALLVMGCDQDQGVNSDNEERAPRLLHWFASGVPEDVELPSHRSLEERKEAMEAFKEASRAFRALEYERNWKAADRRARDLLATPSSVPLYKRQQLAADRMLKHWLLDSPQTPETQEALAFYTEMLVQNRSPQAQILAPALQRLTDTWSDERVAEGAEIAAQAARKHLEKEGVAPDDRIVRAMTKDAGPDEARVLTNSLSRQHYQLV